MDETTEKENGGRKADKTQLPNAKCEGNARSLNSVVLVIVLVGVRKSAVLHRPLVAMLDGHHAGEQGVGQHGAQRRQRGQELLGASVGHVLGVPALVRAASPGSAVICGWVKRKKKKNRCVADASGHETYGGGGVS